MTLPYLVTPEAETLMLETLVRQRLTLRLFVNDISVNDAETYVEATGDGYAAKALDPDGWDVKPGSAEYPELLFQFSGALGNVFGYVVTNASGVVMWCDRFDDGPYAIESSYDELTIEPKLGL